MLNYTKIKSKFIKEQIKKTKWKNRDYIDALIKIEDYVLGATFGWMTGYIVNRLESRYPKEWKIIWNELNPKTFNQITKREEKERQEDIENDRKWKEDEKIESLLAQKQWVSAGGMV